MCEKIPSLFSHCCLKIEGIFVCDYPIVWIARGLLLLLLLLVLVIPSYIAPNPFTEEGLSPLPFPPSSLTDVPLSVFDFKCFINNYYRLALLWNGVVFLPPPPPVMLISDSSSLGVNCALFVILCNAFLISFEVMRLFLNYSPNSIFPLDFLTLIFLSNFI